MASSNKGNYSGSGVLIVDTNRSSVLLVYDYTQNYNCCGGFLKYDIDDPQRLEKTAKEELHEETRTLFSCDLDYLTSCPYIDLEFHDEIFRCYIYKTACENDICTRFENFNLTELPDNDEYRETTSIKLFPLKQFRGKKSWANIDKTSIAQDHTGKNRQLNRRVISVIKEAFEQKLL
ncbi:hypothetical protein I4U23_009063 [Adineta vaga]|nr:hypothetical protein I4U23_009063 [Adineta vaga]